MINPKLLLCVFNRQTKYGDDDYEYHEHNQDEEELRNDDRDDYNIIESTTLQHQNSYHIPIAAAVASQKHQERTITNSPDVVHENRQLESLTIDYYESNDDDGADDSKDCDNDDDTKVISNSTMTRKKCHRNTIHKNVASRNFQSVLPVESVPKDTEEKDLEALKIHVKPLPIPNIPKISLPNKTELILNGLSSRYESDIVRTLQHILCSLEANPSIDSHDVDKKECKVSHPPSAQQKKQQLRKNRHQLSKKQHDILKDPSRYVTIVKTLRKWECNERIQSIGLLVLYKGFVLLDDDDVDATYWIVIQTGFLDVLANAMTHFIDHETIQSTCCAIMLSMVISLNKKNKIINDKKKTKDHLPRRNIGTKLNILSSFSGHDRLPIVKVSKSVATTSFKKSKSSNITRIRNKKVHLRSKILVKFVSYQNHLCIGLLFDAMQSYRTNYEIQFCGCSLLELLSRKTSPLSLCATTTAAVASSIIAGSNQKRYNSRTTCSSFHLLCQRLDIENVIKDVLLYQTTKTILPKYKSINDEDNSYDDDEENNDNDTEFSNAIETILQKNNVKIKDRSQIFTKDQKKDAKKDTINSTDQLLLLAQKKAWVVLRRMQEQKQIQQLMHQQHVPTTIVTTTTASAATTTIDDETKIVLDPVYTSQKLSLLKRNESVWRQLSSCLEKASSTEETNSQHN